jgi:hypothetical protein
MVKLFCCYAFGDDWDIQIYLVGKNEESVKTRFLSILDDDYGWWAGENVEEVNEIDGYKVAFKGKKLKLGENK